jgi:hypothetical protein
LYWIATFLNYGTQKKMKGKKNKEKKNKKFPTANVKLQNGKQAV